MSFRTWMYVFAIGIVACVVSALLWLSWLEFSSYQQGHANERHDAAQYQSRASEQGPETCRPIMDEEGFFVWIGCLAESITVDGGVKQAEYDLKAQQDMAAWAFGMLIVTVWLTAFTLAGIIFVWLTLIATRKIGYDQNRAYLVFAPKSPVTNIGNSATEAYMSFVNNGPTPATDVSSKWIMRSLRKGVELNRKELDFRGAVVGPGSETTWSISGDGCGYQALLESECDSISIEGIINYRTFVGGRGNTEINVSCPVVKGEPMKSNWKFDEHGNSMS